MPENVWSGAVVAYRSNGEAEMEHVENQEQSGKVAVSSAFA